MKNEDDETEQAVKPKRRKGSKKKEKKKKVEGKENESKTGIENETDEVFVAGNENKDENGSKKEQTTKLDDKNDNGAENKPSIEKVNTLPRATRSRSTSERRSFKNLFRKPKLQKQRSLSTGGIQDAAGNDVTVVAALGGDTVTPTDRKLAGEFGLVDKIDSPSNPRVKVKRMTVGEAKKVKSTSKSPVSELSPMDAFQLKPTLEGVGKSESMESHSSSLPDLTNVECSIPFSKNDEDKKIYRRSVSADIGRRKKGPVNHTHSGLGNNENPKSETNLENKNDPSSTSQAVPSNVPLSNMVSNSAFIDKENDGVKSQNSEATPHSLESNKESPHSSHTTSNRDKNPSTSTASDPIDAEQLEKNRKESFSNFMNLSQNLPPRSGSFGSKLLNQNNEEKHDAKSESETIPEAEICSKGKIPDSLSLFPGKSKVEQDVINVNDKAQKIPNTDILQDSKDKVEEKRTYPFLKQNIKNLPTSHGGDHVTAWLAGSQDTIRNEKRGLKLGDSTAPVDEKKNIESDFSNAVSPERGRDVSDQKDQKQNRTLSRSTYKSPRRFSGRSLSKGKDKDSKEKDSKDTDKRVETTGEKEYDKGKQDSAREQKTTQKELRLHKDDKSDAEIAPVSDIPKKGFPLLSESPRIPNVTNNMLGKTNKGNVAKPLVYTTGTQSEIEDVEKRKGSTPISRSVQTSLESLKCDKKDEMSKSKGLKVNLRTTAEGIMKKTNQQNVGCSSSEQGKPDEKNTSKVIIDKTKRKSSRNSSSDSDMAIDISEIDDYSVFKTPESTPAFKRKKLPPLSEIQTLSAEVQKDCDTPDSAPRLTGILKHSTGEPIVKTECEKGDEKEEDTSKPPKKLSLMDIITMKRRLSKHRKKSDLSKRRASKRSIKSLDKEDVKESKKKDAEKSDKTEEPDVKIDTKVIIENETNLSLSKLALLQETDIVDDVIDLNDDFPKKHIKFEPGDEPVASDDPLDDEPALPPPRHLATRRESRMLEKRRKVISCCKQFIAFLFSHIGLCSLVVAYSILGGFIFQALEAPFEEQTRIRVKNERESAITQIMQLAIELEMNKRSRDNFTKEVNLLLVSFQTEVWKATEMNGWNNKDDQSESELQWSFASSLLFAITVMTTIGYGHVAPKTDYGRIVTIGYAVLGIPLTLLCLTNIGDLMATGFRMLYAKVCCGVCCVLFSPTKRRLPDPEKGIEEEMVVQGEEKSPGETIHVPTSLCILVMTAYILLGTLLFSIWEGWDVITGTYFSFITLSTIGFGDVVPGTAMDQWANEQKLVLCAMYLVFGLSLIAMCFNLVQEDVKAKCRWLGAKIGII